MSGYYLHPLLGDANGDRVPDLLAVQRLDSRVRGLFSTGRARWSAPEFLGGVLAQDVVPADVDGDGNTDIIYWPTDGFDGDPFFGAILGARFGVFDLADLVAFVEVFVNGCE